MSQPFVPASSTPADCRRPGRARQPRPSRSRQSPRPASRRPPRPSASSWSDVGHFVAADLSPEHSVLLARGSGAADPRWVACAGKPPAIVAGAVTVLAPGSGAARALDPAARSWLDALRVLGAGTVLVATDPSDAAAVKGAFGKAGLPAPVDGDTLRLAGAASELPAIRAGIGARYCVVALVGRSGADFPNALTPDATPAALGPLWGRGWFLLP